MSSKKLSLRELPEKERPREKLISNGEASLSDAELLAIVLGAGTRFETAVQLAQRILKETKNLRSLERMSVTELCKQFHGIGPARATQLKAAFELSRRYSGQFENRRQKFSNSQAVFQYFRDQFRGKEFEEFWLLSLDAKNQLKESELISRGTLMSSLVHPREIFHSAIRHLSAAIIVVHNHPSGEPEPSPEDRNVTRKLAEAGSLMGIPLLDHVIVGNDSYYSFKDSGAL